MNGVGGDGHRDQNMGIVFKQVNAYGSGATFRFQDSASSILSAPLRVPRVLSEAHSPRRRIFKDFSMLLRSGELLLVLDRPGAGFSTFLKSLCGELHGLELDPRMGRFQSSCGQCVLRTKRDGAGITQAQIKKEFKGEPVYN